jgi:hypothetical protein
MRCQLAKVKRRDLIAAIDQAERHLATLFGRWSGGIPASVRAELLRLGLPLLDILIAEGLRADPLEKRPPPE